MGWLLLTQVRATLSEALGAGIKRGVGPIQSAVHSAHVLCIAAASAVPADSERSQEQSALSMGPVCHTVELICDQNMRSRALCRLPVMKYVSLGSESACALVQPNLVAERHVEWGIHGAIELVDRRLVTSAM